MATVAFDTLAAVRRLREAGYDEQRAGVIGRVIGETQNQLVAQEHFDSGFTLLQWMPGFRLGISGGNLRQIVHSLTQ